MAEYKNVLEAEPDFFKAHNNLGLLAFRKGRKEEALTHYQQALAFDPDFDSALVNLGWYYRDKGMTKEAHEEYQKALTTTPTTPRRTTTSPSCTTTPGTMPKLFAVYQRARDLGYPDNPAFREALAAHER